MFICPTDGVIGWWSQHKQRWQIPNTALSYLYGVVQTCKQRIRRSYLKSNFTHNQPGLIPHFQNAFIEEDGSTNQPLCNTTFQMMNSNGPWNEPSPNPYSVVLTPKLFPLFQFPLFERSLVHLNISFCQRQEIILLHILNLPHSDVLCNSNSGYAKKETLVVQSGKWFQVFLLGNTSLFAEHHVWWSNLKQRV